MHFYVAVPLWLGFVLLIIKLIAASRQPRTINRIIKAPDGREATFVVQSNEPADVTIARMYPGGVVPSQYAKLPPGVLPNHVASANAQLAQARNAPPNFGKALRPFLAVLGIIFVVGLLVSQVQKPPAIPNPAPVYPAPRPPQDATPPSGLGYAQAMQTSISHVRLRTGANIRSGPSRSSAVVRVGQINEVLVLYGLTNGWLRVGKGPAEGWVAESVVDHQP